MRRQLFITGLIAVTVGASLNGCAEKKEGPQTIIIELADPSDEMESSEEESSIEESVSEDASETTEEYTESESIEAETKALAAGYPQIEGLSDDIYLSYTEIGSDDPIIGMVIADMIPDIHATDLTITSVQAYKDNEEIIPYGTVTFNLDVEPNSQVVLYKLDENNKVVSEPLSADENGTVSYQTSNCGRWLIINTNLEATSEAESGEAFVEAFETSEEISSEASSEN